MSFIGSCYFSLLWWYKDTVSGGLSTRSWKPDLLLNAVDNTDNISKYIFIKRSSNQATLSESSNSASYRDWPLSLCVYLAINLSNKSAELCLLSVGPCYSGSLLVTVCSAQNTFWPWVNFWQASSVNKQSADENNSHSWPLTCNDPNVENLSSVYYTTVRFVICLFLVSLCMRLMSF